MVNLAVVGGVHKAPTNVRNALSVGLWRQDILVCPEVDLVAMLGKLIGTLLSPFVRNNLIGITMSHEDGCVLVGVVIGDHVLDLLLQQQVTAQTKYTTQLVLVCDTGQERHGSTLRETSNHDAVGGDALCDFLVDEGVEVVARPDDARLVLFAVIEGTQGLDIVPSWHAHAHVLHIELAVCPVSPWPC
jgi:hypothetical protein